MSVTPGTLPAATAILTALVHDDVETAIAIMVEFKDSDDLLMAMAIGFSNLLKACDKQTPGSATAVLTQLGQHALTLPQ